MTNGFNISFYPMQQQQHENSCCIWCYMANSYYGYHITIKSMRKRSWSSHNTKWFRSFWLNGCKTVADPNTTFQTNWVVNAENVVRFWWLLALIVINFETLKNQEYIEWKKKHYVWRSFHISPTHTHAHVHGQRACSAASVLQTTLLITSLSFHICRSGIRGC